MKDCPEKVTHPLGFCETHGERVDADPAFNPVHVVTDVDGAHLVCGLCGHRVRLFQRVDEEARRRYVLDADPSPDGRCVVTQGGFRVLSPGLVAQCVGEGVPLYRTHAQACEKRSLRVL